MQFIKGGFMGRKYYRKYEDNPAGVILILIIFVIVVLVNFFKEHPVIATLIAILIIAGAVYLVYFLKTRNKTLNDDKDIIQPDKLSEYKGKVNELEIYEILNELQFYKKVIKNVYIPIDGKTTEIDVIMITNTGIYVIESKNYTGWIFGNSNSKYWTLTNKRNKFRFLNPIWQNKLHIESLEKMLEIDNKNFESLIVFGPESVLKKVEILEESIKIICIKDIEQLITKLNNIKPSIYSNEEVDAIYLKLRDYKYVDDSVKSSHINQVNEQI
jgi:Ca2+/Na+ antiporter